MIVSFARIPVIDSDDCYSRDMPSIDLLYSYDLVHVSILIL